MTGTLPNRVGVRGSAVSVEVSPWLLLEARSIAWRQAIRLVVVLCSQGCVWFVSGHIGPRALPVLWLSDFYRVLAVLGLKLFPLLWHCSFAEYWAGGPSFD